MPSEIQKIKNNKTLEWIDVNCPSIKNLKELQKKYHFHDLDIDDCLALTRRSKIDCYDDYTFVIFLYPFFVKKTREIAAVEFDFWIGKNYLISAHKEADNPLSALFDECKKKNKSSQNEILSLPPERLMYEIHLRFVNYCMPMINHLDADLDNIEKKIFSGCQKAMVKEISIIRRNITDYRKIVEPHKNILVKLMKNFKKNKIYSMNEKDVYFENLVDYAQEIWNALESFKERIEALQETNESLIGFKLNDNMSLLTVVSLILIPVNLLATIFGMNTANAPINDFWTLINLMSIMGLSITLIWIFRSKMANKG
ncbi:MAG: magnesium transporter CorA family protein [bacterium]